MDLTIRFKDGGSQTLTNVAGIDFREAAPAPIGYIKNFTELEYFLVSNGYSYKDLDLLFDTTPLTYEQLFNNVTKTALLNFLNKNRP